MASRQSTTPVTGYWVAALLLFFIPAIILVTLDFSYSNPAYAVLDQKYSHLPTIRYMAAHWGSVDYRHFISRSAPGYYLVMAAADRWITDSAVGLRLVNLALTAGLVAVLVYATQSLYPKRLVVLLATPFLFSDSVYTRGLWISTDNLAWLSVVAIVFTATRSPSNGTALAAMFFVPAAVGVRQIHAWTIPFLIISALIAGGLRNAVRMAVAMLPAVLLILYFLFIWGGLEPPGGQAAYSGFSLAPFPMVFSLIGIFGSFFAAALWPEIREAWLRDRITALRFLFRGAAAGALAGIIPVTVWHSFLRQSGIWVLARHTPVFFGRSPAIAVLTIFGGLAGSLMLLAMTRRDRLIFGTALACFTAVHCANTSIFERYYEPFLLIVLSFATARVLAASTLKTDSAVRAAGPALLTAVQIALTVWRLSTPMQHR